MSNELLDEIKSIIKEAQDDFLMEVKKLKMELDQKDQVIRSVSEKLDKMQIFNMEFKPVEFKIKEQFNFIDITKYNVEDVEYLNMIIKDLLLRDRILLSQQDELLTFYNKAMVALETLSRKLTEFEPALKSFVAVMDQISNLSKKKKKD